VLTVSATVGEQIAQRFAPRALDRVPNAGDHLPRLPRAPGPRAPLLHVGHLEARKNLALLLRALALDPGLPGLELAGGDGGEAARLAGLARELGLEGRVRFLGPVSDPELARLYARCAAVAIPSRLEGFGIGVLEAQRARAPLAVAAAGALLEVAGPGVPHFAPDDVAGCAAALRAALAARPEALEASGLRAERFSWADSARALVRSWTEAAGLT